MFRYQVWNGFICNHKIRIDDLVTSDKFLGTKCKKFVKHISILILDFEHTRLSQLCTTLFKTIITLSLSLLKIYRLDGLRERIIFINANRVNEKIFLDQATLNYLYKYFNDSFMHKLFCCYIFFVILCLSLKDKAM